MFRKFFHAFFKYRKYCGGVSILSNPPRFRCFCHHYCVALFFLYLPDCCVNICMVFTTTSRKRLCQPSDTLVRCNLLIAVLSCFHNDFQFLGLMAESQLLAGFPVIKNSLNSSYTPCSSAGQLRHNSGKEVSTSALGTKASASSICMYHFTVLSSGYW